MSEFLAAEELRIDDWSNNWNNLVPVIYNASKTKPHLARQHHLNVITDGEKKHVSGEEYLANRWGLQPRPKNEIQRTSVDQALARTLAALETGQDYEIASGCLREARELYYQEQIKKQDSTIAEPRDQTPKEEALIDAWIALEYGSMSYDGAIEHVRKALCLPKSPALTETSSVVHEKNPRFKRTALPLAVASTAVAAFFGPMNPSQTNNTIEKAAPIVNITPEMPKPAVEVLPKMVVSKVKPAKPEAYTKITVKNAPTKLQSEQLNYYGDTITNHGKEDLIKAMGGKNPTQLQIVKWVQRIMNLKENKNNILNSQGRWHSTLEGARHLPVGFKFQVSKTITNLIARRG